MIFKTAAFNRSNLTSARYANGIDLQNDWVRSGIAAARLPYDLEIPISRRERVLQIGIQHLLTNITG